MIKHATEQARALRDFNPSCPDGLQQIVNWMMAKELSGRYPTPARAAQALEVFLTAGAAPASSPDLDPGMQPYLSWLENLDRRGGPVPTPQGVNLPAPPAGAIPTAAPVARAAEGGKPPSSPAVEMPGRGEDRGPARRKKTRRLAKHRTPPPVPAGELEG